MPDFIDPPKPVPDECLVFRLIKDPAWIKSVDGDERPTSQAFCDPRDSSMSVFLPDEICTADRTVEDLLADWPGYRICYFTAGQLRNEFKQEIARKPINGFPGHGEVVDPSGKRSAGIRSKMARAARWYAE